MFFFSALFLFSQNELNPSDWKMTQAKLLYEDNKFQDALDIYLELYKEYPVDAFLNYRISLCYYKVGEYDNSGAYCKIALDNCKDANIEKDIVYLKACIYHKQENFSEAKEYLNKILMGTSSVDSNDIKIFMKQINLAEEHYKSPVDCKLTAIDVESEVNSEFNEIFPVCSRRENKLYFTSDRQISDNQDRNAITNNFPFSIFESKISSANKLEIPVLVDETFASGKNYVLGSVSAADKLYFLFKETPEEKDGGDLYIDSLDTDEDFTDPVKIESELNTKFLEYSPSYDFINTRLYFVSNHKDLNKTKSSIFVSELFKNYFPEPDIIKKISYDTDQSFVYVHPGGDFMVFAMDGENSMGGYDLFICYNDTDKWSEPINMGYPINTSSDEMQFSLSSDGKTAYISSNRLGGYGGFDIYTFDFNSVINKESEYCLEVMAIYGQITDESGEAIQTDMIITDAANSKIEYKVSSDINGYYSFGLKKESKYNLEIKNKAYEAFSEEIDLTQNILGNSHEKDIELVIKQ